MSSDPRREPPDKIEPGSPDDDDHIIDELEEDEDEEMLDDGSEDGADEKKVEETTAQKIRVTSAKKRSPRRRRRRKVHSGDLFLLLVLFGMIVVFVRFELRDLFAIFYDKTVGAVLVVMVIEYLVLKSMDRTRVYRLENRGLRERRRVDQALLRRARVLLEEHLEESEDEQDEEKRERWKRDAQMLSDEIHERT